MSATATKPETKKKGPSGPVVDYVLIPRAAFSERLWSLSWDALKERATRGEDGMSVISTPGTMATDNFKRVIRYDDWPEGAEMAVWRELTDTAVMRQCEAPRRDLALLHAQSW